MISIDREKVKKAVENIGDIDYEDKSELIEALGGEALREVFDDETIEFICKSIHMTGRLHSYSTPMEEDGLDVLEGLLNRRVEGDLGDFYNVKYDYIMSLPKDQREKIAKSFAQGVEPLEKLLLASWDKNIQTAACGGSNQNAYVLYRIPKEDMGAITRIGNAAYNKNLAVTFRMSKDMVEIDIHSQDLAMYQDLLDELTTGDDLNKVNFFKSIVMAAGTSYDTGRKTGQGDRTDILVKHQMELRAKDKAIEGLKKELEEKDQTIKELEEENTNLSVRFLSAKRFIVEKVGAIPLMGRLLLKAFNKELGERQLKSANEEETR